MPELHNRAAIAYAETFFEARRRLPNSVLPDLFNFIEKFTNDPTARGLNYEKLAVIDTCLRSARVNRSYRAIIRIPNENAKNIYTLLWVDSHDEAYYWARRKKIVVDPVTNYIEIYDVITREEIDISIPNDANEPKLFDNISDKEFQQIRISSDYLFIIRAIQNEEDIEKVKRFLPASVFENLSYLAAGIPFAEVAQMVAEDFVEDNRETETFEQAVTDIRNKNQFYIVDGEEGAEELKQVLDNPLDQWRIFLHPLQRRVVEMNFYGPARILGGAGTGKTIVAMHRAKWLAENVFTLQGDKILFTTFSSNLAWDISACLKKMCKPEIYHKIEVVNLDKWVSSFLSQNCIQERLIFGDEVKEVWKKAIASKENSLGLPMAFYIDEYEKIVLANEIKSFNEYRLVNRAGRGIALNRIQKSQVWSIIEAYMTLLKKTKVFDGASAAVRVKEIISCSSSSVTYKAVIVDEGQDFGAASFKLIRALAGAEHENDIFIVGDAHQRIYGKKVVLKDCGINIVGRSGILKINYRTTEEIRKFAQKVLEGIPVDDLDDRVDEGREYLSLTHGKKPEVLNFDFEIAQNEGIYEQIRKWNALGVGYESICIVTRMNKQLDVIRRFLNEKGISMYEVKNSKAEDTNVSGVRISTMHRVKGLEFDYVIVASANDGIIPLNTLLESSTDPINRKELYDAEQSLLYVAMTRAKKELVITSFGKPSSLLRD